MSVYLKPEGLLSGDAARLAVERGDALPLAGGWLAFTRAERIRRANGEVRREHVSLDELSDLSGDEAKVLKDLTAPRPDLAGLSLDRPRLMGILNATPDSFSDGGVHFDERKAIAAGHNMAASGADILDIGGESTRPNANPVSEDAEMDRVLGSVKALSGAHLVSIDTRKSGVMKAALDAGASMVNDVSALSHDPRSLETVVAARRPTVLMHASGDPTVMQSRTDYDDVVLDVFDFLAERVKACEAAGLPRRYLCVDPGIGFGKTRAQNYALLRDLAVFHCLGCPLMLGASRKSFLNDLPGADVAADRLGGSLGAAWQGSASGAQILRVHDVTATAQLIGVYTRLHVTA